MKPSCTPSKFIFFVIQIFIILNVTRYMTTFVRCDVHDPRRLLSYDPVMLVSEERSGKRP